MLQSCPWDEIYTPFWVSLSMAKTIEGKNGNDHVHEVYKSRAENLLGDYGNDNITYIK